MNLVEDVERLPANFFHYAGPILFLHQESLRMLPSHTMLSSVSIEDGQQRCTTLFLVARILADYFEKNLPQDRNALHTLENILFEYNGEDSIRRLQSANEDFDELLTAIIEESSADNTQPTASMVRLANMFNQIESYVHSLNPDEVKILYHNLFKRLRFVPIDLDHERVNASIAFHTINSRGVPLKAFDVVKNHLMYFVEQSAQELNRLIDSGVTQRSVVITKSKVEASWFQVIETLERHGLGDKEDDYLTFTYRLFLQTDEVVQKDHVANRIEIDFRDYFEHLSNTLMQEDERLYRALLRVKNFVDLWTELVEEFGLIRNKSKLAQIFADRNVYSEWAHKILKIHTLRKPGIFSELLTVCKLKFSPDENKLIADLAYKSVFRVYSIQKGRRIDHKGGPIRKLVNDVYFGNATSRDVQKFLVTLIIESGDVNDCIRQLFGDNPILYNNKARELGWFATEYEYFLLNTLGTTPARFDMDGKTIEHILPQQTSATGSNSYYQLRPEWQQNWTESEFNACKHRIGNLVMTNSNSELGNKSFDKKCNDSQAYCYSDARASKSEQQLADTFNTWDINSLRKREVMLLEFFLLFFRVDSPKEYGGIEVPHALRQHAIGHPNSQIQITKTDYEFNAVDLSSVASIEDEEATE